MIAMNAPVRLNEALTVHGEVSIQPWATQTVNAIVAQDPANPLPALQQTAPPLPDLCREGGFQLSAGGGGHPMAGDFTVNDSGAMVPTNPDGVDPEWRDLELWEFTEQLKRSSERDISNIKQVVENEHATLYRVGEALEHFRENVHQGDLIRDAWIKQQMEGIAEKVNTHEDSMTANLG